jgi:hypothetical protein
MIVVQRHFILFGKLMNRGSSADLLGNLSGVLGDGQSCAVHLNLSRERTSFAVSSNSLTGILGVDIAIVKGDISIKLKD